MARNQEHGDCVEERGAHFTAERDVGKYESRHGEHPERRHDARARHGRRPLEVHGDSVRPESSARLCLEPATISMTPQPTLWPALPEGCVTRSSRLS